MTLCVVTRHQQTVQVATDSRLNWDKKKADIGIKVMTLPLRIYHPTTQGDDAPPQVAYSRTLGLAVLGSMTTTFVAKQLLETVLSSLQYVPGATDISMAGIANVCARVLRGVSRDVCRALGAGGTGQLVLVGRCLVTGHARVFILSVVTREEALEVEIEEFTTEDEPLFLGSGAGAASSAVRRHSMFAFDVVREVAADPKVTTVGGNVQFGILEANRDDFRITGIRDYRVDHDRKEIYVSFSLGGLEIIGAESLLATTDFSFMTPFLNPVRSEIDRLIDRGYNVVNSTDDW